MLLHELPTAAAEDRAQDQGDEDRVVELARNGDEVGDEVERHGQVGDEPAQDQFVSPGKPAVARQSGEEERAVGHEACERPRFLPAAREE